ncbi:MAG TPA: lysophospholipid acyltransferase family protein [Geothrix sp.]|jgi:1-acyl-sn-glycerol-3-phosphate acyltransferase|nr:lysophospholipid acyltransferase family protein [Geothrix sp.]
MNLFSSAVLLALLVFAWRAAMRALDRAAGADWGGKWVNRIDGLNRIFCRRWHRLSAECLPLPESGPALLVANHISGLDPLLLIAASRRPLRFIIAKEQYHRFGLEWLFRAAGCIPVDRSERPERAFREALRVLKAGEVVALFPHGKIHLDTDPPRPLKQGVARFAHLAKIPVHAARIEGVAGRGEVVKAVFLRGHARVSGAILVPCHELATHECLERVAAIIENRAPGSS